MKGTMVRETFDPASWRTLQTAPLWVFSALVGRQSDFHPWEEQAFRTAVEESAAVSAGLAAEVLASLSTDREELVDAYAHEGRPIVSGLRDALALLAMRDASMAVDFAGALLDVAERLATARGPFGRMISEEDGEILQLLAEVLEVEPPRGRGGQP